MVKGAATDMPLVARKSIETLARSDDATIRSDYATMETCWTNKVVRKWRAVRAFQKYKSGAPADDPPLIHCVMGVTVAKDGGAQLSQKHR